ncbi:MAG: hypothetical protein Q8P57_04575 [Candidatus Pacearchaeota archaeon]|nr:hypothetical protein [Candidatus Pacearchaeota archaeon]
MFGSNSCIVCGDSISDPVCRSCYIKQIKVLLNESKEHPIAKEIILKKIKKEFPLESQNDIECILCQRENVGMCRYCFSIILRELNFTGDLIEEFGFNSMNEEIYLENQIIG